MEPSFYKEDSHAKAETSEEEKHQNTNKYTEIIASLPNEKRWSASCDFYEYEGFWNTLIFLEAILELQEHFKAHPTDIFICSFPKSGTTWLKALSFAIVTRKQYDEHNHPLLTTMPHECVPFMEVDLVDDAFTRDPELRLLSTHIPFTSLPKSIIAAGCKIVYIWRDPKDTFVSFYHFLRRILERDAKVVSESISFQEEFELFCEGKSFYGPFWEHILGYWEESKEKPEKVLFLKYEDMKRDTLFYIRKLAEFLDEPFSEEEEMGGVPQKIMEMCSFERLSSLEVNKRGKHRPNTPLEVNNNVYFRKGQVGDWKNHLTEKMQVQLNYVTKQKLGGSGLMFDASSRP